MYPKAMVDICVASRYSGLALLSLASMTLSDRGSIPLGSTWLCGHSTEMDVDNHSSMARWARTGFDGNGCGGELDVWMLLPGSQGGRCPGFGLRTHGFTSLRAQQEKTINAKATVVEMPLRQAPAQFAFAA